MRINNIVFSGVMATILASVAGVASAATVNLASKTYVDDALAQKQNVLTAGEGIEISDNVVKSTIDVSNFLLKHDMPDFNNLATHSDLVALERALQAEIAAKHASGDYATAAQLQELKNTVETLQTGGADKAAIESLQASVATISADYAKKSELDKTEQDLRDAINVVDAAVQAIDLSQYATVEDVDAKLLLKANASALNTLKSTLEAAIAEKQEKGDYLEAEDLTAINTAISNLESGKADVATVTALQSAINNLGNTYATKTDLTGAETRLQNAINAIEIPSLSEYAKSADVAAVYATKESLADYATIDDMDAGLLAKANVTALADYAKKNDLQAKADVSQLNALQQTVSDNVGAIADNAKNIALKANIADVYTKTQVDDKVAEVVAGDMDEALKSYAKVADVESTYATKQLVETIAGRVGVMENSDFQTGDDVQGAITTAVADLATKSELNAKADASALSSYALKSELPSTENLATKSELNGLVTSEQLEKLRTDLEAEIAKKQASGDYATATALKAVSDSLAEYAKASSVYTKAEVDDMIANVASDGNLNLSGYATVSALEALQILVNGKQDTITDLATIRAGAEKGATAVQPGAITPGTENGSIAVDGTDVPVKGLGTAAYASVDSLVEKPALPMTDGDYLLMVSYQEGVHTYSWEDATKFTTAGSDEGWDDSGW